MWTVYDQWRREKAARIRPSDPAGDAPPTIEPPDGQLALWPASVATADDDRHAAADENDADEIIPMTARPVRGAAYAGPTAGCVKARGGGA